MPRSRTRLLGIVLLSASLLTACGALAGPSAAGRTAAPTTATAASPSAAAGGWVQNLDFSGDFSGHLGLIAPPGPNQNSECTGKGSRSLGAWASTLYGQVGPDVIAVIVLVSSGYRGPGTYDPGNTLVQVANGDRSHAWSNQGGDPIAFTVASDEESGTIDATLTNLGNGKSKLKVTGRWSCKT